MGITIALIYLGYLEGNEEYYLAAIIFDMICLLFIYGILYIIFREHGHLNDLTEVTVPIINTFFPVQAQILII